ncbi:LysR family transcriptional regulator [Mangrovibacter yixingensis]|uniref:LysR family transcriptional regulator n=1 Tax=Mangrovibacter yixingensis TaxID=1529639 RepID=UPI001CFA9E77|nr:LysR family transcriptional regulator [Mangrovibacter yixingensis]
MRIFLEVYRSGSLSAAARKLRIDVSTVSRHIASLEKALSAPVFQRLPSGLKVTTRGREIVSHIESMESHSLAMVQTDKAILSDLPAGEIRIGTMEGIASFYLASQIGKFNEKYPDIMVELLTSPHQVHVNRREADLFLSFYAHDVKGLDILPVGKFRLYLYAHSDYLQQYGVPANVSDLSHHKFISYIGDLIQLDTVRWLDDAINNPKIIFSSSSLVAQMFAAASGTGIAMLPEFMKAERFGLQRVLENTVEVSRVVWLSVHSELRYLPKMKVFINFLLNIFENDYPNTPGIRLE